MWSKRIKNAHRLLSCDVTSRHYPTTNGPSWPASSPPEVHHQTPSCNLRVPSVPLRARVQCRPAYITVATRKTTATVERRLQWRRGKQLQQWNVAYSGDEENNCNSELQDIRDIETVNYSDIVRKGNYRNEHVQITANVQGHSGHSNGRE
ncbi:hypothetical protein J6590_096479 [Homalodisca vitripennis]|nr:hypothetical protein J6590_096479 [Homalodisca vitripennis]